MSYESRCSTCANAASRTLITLPEYQGCDPKHQNASQEPPSDNRCKLLPVDMCDALCEAHCNDGKDLHNKPIQHVACYSWNREQRLQPAMCCFYCSFLVINIVLPWTLMPAGVMISYTARTLVNQTTMTMTIISQAEALHLLSTFWLQPGPYTDIDRE